MPYHLGFNATKLAPEELSGISVYTWALLPALAKLGMKITIFTTSSPHQLPAEVQALGLDTVTLPYVENGWKHSLFSNTRLKRAAEHAGAHLLFSTFGTTSWFGKFKKAVVVHDLYQNVYPAFTPWTHRVRMAILSPLSYFASSAVIAVSPCTGRDVARFFPFSTKGKLHVVNSASPIAALDAQDVQAPKKNPAYALFVANVTPNKNVQALAQAAAMLKNPPNPVVIYHVGRDAYGLLAAAITEHGVQDSFISLGKKSQDDMEKLMQEATCILTPSFYEGFCFPALEAQAMNIPLVSSTGGALPDTAGGGALYFEPEDASTLAKHIITLATQPAERLRMIAAGRKNLALFSWDKAAMELHHIFLNVLKKSA